MKIKYPRTLHLPWSEGATSDDKKLTSDDIFVGRKVVVTEKMDGENTSLYSDHYHARSLDSKHHPSRDHVKSLWGQIRHTIPQGWRICGENLYAKHSIFYDNLPSYFMAFSVWNEENEALSWDDTVEFCTSLGLKTVPVIYSGSYDPVLFKAMWDRLYCTSMEGYVVRITDSFKYEDFTKSVAKFVRENHVQTTEHWMNSVIVPNKLTSKTK